MHQKIAYWIANFDNISPYFSCNPHNTRHNYYGSLKFKGKQATITKNSVIHTHNRLQTNRLMGLTYNGSVPWLTDLRTGTKPSTSVSKNQEPKRNWNSRFRSVWFRFSVFRFGSRFSIIFAHIYWELDNCTRWVLWWKLFSHPMKLHPSLPLPCQQNWWYLMPWNSS